MKTMYFKLTVLSPVHVGCGLGLSRNLDFFTEKNTTFLLDIDSAIHAFPDLWLKQDTLDARRLKDLLVKAGGAKFVRMVTPPIMADEIRLQMRDGRGAVLIPGSTIKGALRTAFLSYLAFQDIGSKKKLVSETIQEGDVNRPGEMAKLFEARFLCGRPERGGSPGPREDLFRAVLVGDCAISQDFLEIFEVRVRSPLKNEPRREKEFVLACEGVRSGATGYMRIGVDDFLLEKKSRSRTGLPDCEIGFARLAQATREHMLRIIDEERRYFEWVGLQEAVNFLDLVKKEIGAASGNTMYLRLGWGIGWCGTTGAILDPDERLNLLYRFEREQKTLGKRDAKIYDNHTIIFPKSRRYIASNKHPPLFGFVRLEEAKEEEVFMTKFQPCTFPQAEIKEVPREEEKKPSLEVETVARAPEVKKPSYVEVLISSLKPREIKPRFQGLLLEIQSLKDPDERMRGLRALKEMVLKYVPKTDEAFYSRPDVVKLLEEVKDNSDT